MAFREHQGAEYLRSLGYGGDVKAVLNQLACLRRLDELLAEDGDALCRRFGVVEEHARRIVMGQVDLLENAGLPFIAKYVRTGLEQEEMWRAT